MKIPMQIGRAGVPALAVGLLGCLLATSAPATTLFAEAHYNAPGDASAGIGPGVTPVTGSPQTSPVSVDILDFFTAGAVNFGVHTYGNVGTFTSFGNRVSADFVGSSPASYDVDGLFSLTLPDADVGTSFSFNIVPGEVSANGPNSVFLGTDFVSAAVDLRITVGGTEVFRSQASARSDAGGAVAGFTGTNIGYSCTSPGAGAGASGCSITGGVFTLDLSAVTGDLVYTIFAEAHGRIQTVYSDCSSFGGGGDGGPPGNGDVAAALIENPAFGSACGSIARTGDPLPEPATLALAGLGVALLAFTRRRRMQTTQG